MVKPLKETPSGSVWLSNLDLVFSDTYHSRVVYFYRSDRGPGFFDTATLKEALSRALVEFYPYAGRLRRDDNGRIEINCNDEGVSFVEAECDGSIDDLGDFAIPKPHLSLTPTVDYSKGISTFPLLLLKVPSHVRRDFRKQFDAHVVGNRSRPNHRPYCFPGPARPLGARAPAAPVPPHRAPPSSVAQNPLDGPAGDPTFSTFKLSRDFINGLKKKCNESSGGANYTMYEVVAGHVWRCVSIARGLPLEQETKLQFPVDARQRLRPPLPPGYFGNGIFYSGAFALVGDLVSKPLRFAVEIVHEAIARMDDEYMRSALDYLELYMRNVEGIVRSQNNVKCPNFGVTSWVRLPVHKAEFGLGKPVFVGPGGALSEGKSFLYPDQENEEILLLAITLHHQHMERFQKLLYDKDSCMMPEI
ncbi:hypothetical protein SASPL_156149 [Salvia splendens]|uniref:Shikimate O-hydroxycinnamoyltransferase n=1 Tax=Salvia splendens TaxID=180675 RepID=A0A8X8VXC2_SALSN|nr:hypothetical protein SASPL_156149 [Salvia splendens]